MVGAYSVFKGYYGLVGTHAKVAEEAEKVVVGIFVDLLLDDVLVGRELLMLACEKQMLGPKRQTDGAALDELIQLATNFLAAPYMQYWKNQTVHHSEIPFASHGSRNG